MTTAPATTRLEDQMTQIVGTPVELTVRGLKSFTFSTEEVTCDLGEKVAAYFGKLAQVTVEHDEECGSCAYVEVVGA